MPFWHPSPAIQALESHAWSARSQPGLALDDHQLDRRLVEPLGTVWRHQEAAADAGIEPGCRHPLARSFQPAPVLPLGEGAEVPAPAHFDISTHPRRVAIAGHRCTVMGGCQAAGTKVLVFYNERPGGTGTGRRCKPLMSEREKHRSRPSPQADDRVPGDARPVRGSRPGTTAAVNRARILIGVAIVAALAGAYALLSWTGALATITHEPTLARLVVELGVVGPLAIIGLLAVAIVLNPIPSAPIALAAGAAYGHLWGTVYVVIGAEIGALTAFAIARLVGYEVLQRWFGKRPSLGSSRSQNALMAIVFASRLLPFVSFDLVSYAAGLTPLAPWRFAVATLAGIIPASFLLAHFGGEMASADADRILLAVLALGALTLLPFAGKMLLDRYRDKRADRRSAS